MRVVVTGGSGFLGEEIVRQLLPTLTGNDTLILFSRTAPSPSTPPSGASGTPRVEWLKGSVEDASAVAAAVAGCDVVFHLAGSVEHTRSAAATARMRAVHVGATRNVLAAVAPRTRVVYSSTSGVVACAASAGDPPYSDKVEDDDDDGGKGKVQEMRYCSALVANWPYYHTKIEAEKEALAVAKARDVDLVVMRPTLILGPGDARLSSTRTIYDFLRGDVPLIPAGGLSIVDVRDAAAAFIVAAQADRAVVRGKTYLLGDYNMTLRDYFSLVSRISKVPMPLLAFLRVPFAVIHAFCRIVTFLLSIFGLHNATLDPVVAEMANVFWYIDAYRARRDLRFRPRPLQDTIADTVAYIRSHQTQLAKIK